MAHDWLDITPPGCAIGQHAQQSGAVVAAVIAMAAARGIKLEGLELRRRVLLAYICAADDAALVAARATLVDAAAAAARDADLLDASA